MNDMTTNSENKSQAPEKKRKYQAPHLLVYGEMTTLTAAGSGAKVEPGMSMNPNRRP